MSPPLEPGYPHLHLKLIGTTDCLWRYSVPATGAALDIGGPIFEMEGRAVTCTIELWDDLVSTHLTNGVIEHRCRGPVTFEPGLELEIVWRVAPDNPVVRFRYVLHSQRPRQLTKVQGQDALCYLTTSLAAASHIKEIQFSQFNEMVHSFCLAEQAVEARHFDNAVSVMGPMLVAGTEGYKLLLAYEHGSQVPDAFLHFALTPDRNVALRAVKGNYYDGQVIDADHPYETLWMQAAVVSGNEDDLAAAYREFVLRYQSENLESRKPYIFYNTWAYQERNKWWSNTTFLASMTQERILAEIDVAHRMGVDVYVIDTGWFEKTGDWRVNRARFPDGLHGVKAKLDSYGMKLGLWFDPPAAAMSSRIRREHADCLMSRDGKVGQPRPIWETEESQWLCLVSRYWEAFADELIRLVAEVGVTYFKWDAIGQYGCSDAGHYHGIAANSEAERRDCYAFQLGPALARIVDKLCAACPEAIVDFDITEGGRAVGLGFLSAGKYFLINNGPYYHNFDVPYDGTYWSNLFVHPGPARAWMCRTPLTFDKWIPSVLFLTHYLPDDPADSQWINLASLVLGQNGIWGDLLTVADEGIARFGNTLARYKQVREDLTHATLRRTGHVGGSPEIYEKIDPATGRGVVAIFASAGGEYQYITHYPVDALHWHNEGVSVSHDAAGRAVVTAKFERVGAKLVFFGVAEE